MKAWLPLRALLEVFSKLSAVCLKTKTPAEKGDHVILETVGHFARVSALIDFEAVRNSVLVQQVMQLAGVRSQPVLVSHIYRYASILSETSDVLVHESQRRIRRPLREDVRLGRAVLRRQVEVKRGILGIWRPCRRGCELSARKERQIRRIFGRLDSLQALCKI